MGFYSSSHVLQQLATLILFIKIMKRSVGDCAYLFLSIMIARANPEAFL